MAAHDRHLKVRVSSDLKAWVARQAVQNCRSLNGEMVHMIEESRLRAEKVSQSTPVEVTTNSVGEA